MNDPLYSVKRKLVKYECELVWLIEKFKKKEEKKKKKKKKKKTLALPFHSDVPDFVS